MPKSEKEHDPLLQQALDTFSRLGSASLAARELKLPRTTFRDRLQRALDLEYTATNDGKLRLFGVSTLRNSEGKVILEWEKQKVESELIEQRIKSTIQSFVEPIRGLHKPIKKPSRTVKGLLSEYIIADAHLGMLAHADEAGEHYDLRIARDKLFEICDKLISYTPPSDECLINQLGDFYHVDDNRNQTPTGHNPLDVDGRYYKVINAGVQTMRYIIGRALKKHRMVRVRNTAGNHDIHSGIALNVALIGYYENDPRVIIENSPLSFWAYKFGKNLIGVGHGDDPKPQIMPKLLAHDYPEWWGMCDHKYIRHGHFHNKNSFEDMGVEVECFRTIAPNDAWHTKKGYRAKKCMQAIVIDIEQGEVERYTAGVHKTV